MPAFKRIALTGRLVNREAADTFRQLCDWFAARDCELIVDEEVAVALELADVEVGSAVELGANCDLAVVVGGDGSLLAAARNLYRHQVPVLGINRGRLGFLTDVSPHQIDSSLAAVLDGDYTLDTRFMLQMELRREGRLLGDGVALNDVVLDSGVSARMIEFQLYVDDVFVHQQRADGLIVSTPTGSTAYSLSAGGPIMHPDLDALVLVPMFPHTLSSRPLVVDGNASLRVCVNEYNELHPLVSCDGQVSISAAPGDEISIVKAQQPLRLVHPPGQDFYASCRDKLGWGSRPGQ
jgi:NAD+ kinase